MLTYVLAGALLFSLGFARAVWVRAKKDYKATKAAVKPLRKAMWSSILRTFRIAVVVVMVGAVLVVWVVNDAKEREREPTPAQVPSPASTR